LQPTVRRCIQGAPRLLYVGFLLPAVGAGLVLYYHPPA
jgi:hypothetical protein